MAGEIVRVASNLVGQNPFAPQCTPESMMTDLAEMGTVAQWCTKYGQMCDHDTSMMESVERLLTEGVTQWNFKPTLEKLYSIAPGATPVTWWIYLNAENRTYKLLYSKLATCVQDFHPFVWNDETTRASAVAFLRAVQDEMKEEQGQWLRGQYEAYSRYAAGAGPIAG